MGEASTSGPPLKTADRPHRWTVALSLLAAAISICSATFSWLSLNETRINRHMNEETSRAYLRLTALLLDASLFSENDWANKSLTGFVTLTNTGRVSARDVSALLDMNPPHAANLFEIARFKELPPGSSNTVRIVVKMDHSKSLTQLSDTKEYVLGLKVEYVDGVSREARTDESTFCMPMDKIKSKGMVSLYSCDIHFAGSDESNDPQRNDK